ncbi:hypothetical protein L226DRAFT_468524, partial [Lentinus tigrinus ALCF2SS1-7]
QLPASLFEWRDPGHDPDDQLGESIWQQLRNFFKSCGYTYWILGYQYTQLPPDESLICNGFGYASLQRGWDDSKGENPLCHAARAGDGRDVVIRALSIGSQGRKHVEILKLLSSNHCSVIYRNHAIPVFEFVQYNDITFGIFPKIGFTLTTAYGNGFWAKNSVGDIVDMIMQCIEALSFIHYVGVAHMDAFRDNFLVQFYPESLAMNRIAVTRPRVYLTDFETAVYFPPDVPIEKRVCVGLPNGDSFSTDSEQYGRPKPPELLSDAPYDPFKLDVWQLATSYADLTYLSLRTTISSIDEIMKTMRSPDPSSRPTSRDALYRLIEVVASLPPQSLLIPPEIAVAPLSPEVAAMIRSLPHDTAVPE